jgi:rubrerythrin
MDIEPIGGAERKEKEDVTDDVIGSGSGERATGTPNTIYDLSSVLFHALEGGASYDTYIEDAEREGDEELTEFFRRVRDEDSMRADEAQRLLAERTSTASMEGSTSPTMGGAEGAATSMAGGAAVDASSRTEASSARPGTTEEVPPARAGEASPPGEGISPRTEPSFARERMEEAPARESRIEEEPLSRPEGTPPPEPGTSGDLPRAEPRREEDASTARTEEVPRAEEVPSGTPPQAPPGDVQSETSPEAPSRTEGASPPDRGREEREERGLLDRAMDALRGRDEEPRREESERRESREDEPPPRR